MTHDPYEKHPTYGMIGASRFTCHPPMRLFGSKLPGHASGISIRIYEAQVSTMSGEDRFFAGGRRIAEVRLSPVQWAEFLTNMNVGDGVPCTIEWALGDTARRGEVPSRVSEPEQVKAEFSARIRSHVIRVSEHRSDLAARLLGRVPKNVARDIDDVLRAVQVELESNMPYFVDQFARGTARISAAAKAEVDAFITHTAHVLGMKALGETAARGFIEADSVEADSEEK